MYAGRKRSFSSGYGSSSSKRTRIVPPSAVKAVVQVQKAFRRKRAFGNPLFDTSRVFPETKYATLSAPSGTVTYTPFVGLINAISQGTDATNRIGREIILKSFEFRMNFCCDTTGLNTWESLGLPGRTIRIVCVYDRQTDGAAPAWTQVYNTGTGSSTNHVNAERNQDFMERFVILFDEVHQIGSAGPNFGMIHRYVKMGLRTKYAGTSAAIGDIVSGSLYLLAVDNNGSGQYLTNLSWQGKLTFSDV